MKAGDKLADAVMGRSRCILVFGRKDVYVLRGSLCRMARIIKRCERAGFDWEVMPD
jgi:hypothetical protein